MKKGGRVAVKCGKMCLDSRKFLKCNQAPTAATEYVAAVSAKDSAASDIELALNYLIRIVGSPKRIHVFLTS
jgi:hypothetical protein